MSAANRGAKRRPHDNYPTPAWVTRAILPRLNQRAFTEGTVLEPACGEGALLAEVLRAMPEVRCSWAVIGIDIREDAVDAVWEQLGFAANVADFLDREHPRWGNVRESATWPPNLIITNPPYSLALQFAQRALEVVAPGGQVALLVRLGWLASQSRARFHAENPADVYVLPRRPSFTADGRTDAADYCWWVRTDGQREGRLHHLVDVVEESGAHASAPPTEGAS